MMKQILKSYYIMNVPSPRVLSSRRAYIYGSLSGLLATSDHQKAGKPLIWKADEQHAGHVRGTLAVHESISVMNSRENVA